MTKEEKKEKVFLEGLVKHIDNPEAEDKKIVQIRKMLSVTHYAVLLFIVLYIWIYDASVIVAVAGFFAGTLISMRNAVENIRVNTASTNRFLDKNLIVKRLNEIDV